jgi:CHAD domain-containing protein
MHPRPSRAIGEDVTKRSTEVETKFGVHGLFVLPELVDPEAGIVATESRPRLTLRATYVDTPSLRLARDRITVRHRTGEGAPRWTLKLPRTPPAEGLQREETSVAGAVASVPGELQQLLTGALRGETLRPVAVLRTVRDTVVLLDSAGGVLGEVVDDTVSLLEGRRVVSRFREIEIERGDADHADPACRAAGARLLEAGAVAGEQLPKVVRALGPKAQQPSDLPAPPAVGPRSPAGDLVLWSLRSGLRRLLAHDIGVRRAEPDAVHQMRVACRRLRSDLRTFADLIDDSRAATLREELAWLADSLGEARDLEVLIERVVKTAGEDPLTALDAGGVAAVGRLLAAQEEAALQATQAALEQQRYVDLLNLLVQTAAEPTLTELAERPCREVLPGLVGSVWQHLAKRASKLRVDDPDVSWHKARILAKRARYAAEVAAVALGKPAKVTAAAAAELQEILGEHQDAAVAADRVLALAPLAPRDLSLAITCGRLAERERAHVHQSRRTFGGVWKDARRQRSTGWMKVV